MNDEEEEKIENEANLEEEGDKGDRKEYPEAGNAPDERSLEEKRHDIFHDGDARAPEKRSEEKRRGEIFEEE